jgi:hypothetical protein
MYRVLPVRAHLDFVVTQRLSGHRFFRHDNEQLMLSVDRLSLSFAFVAWLLSVQHASFRCVEWTKLVKIRNWVRYLRLTVRQPTYVLWHSGHVSCTDCLYACQPRLP